MTKEAYQKKARDNFINGMNCAQAVAAAFSGICGTDAETLNRLASGFGGGFGRMREVCGTISGAILVLNLTEWIRDKDGKLPSKAAHYEKVQSIMKAFRAENGSYICRELLGVDGAEPPVPEARTAAYYQKRPCAELVATSAGILYDQLLRDGVLTLRLVGCESIDNV